MSKYLDDLKGKILTTLFDKVKAGKDSDIILKSAVELTKGYCAECSVSDSNSMQMLDYMLNGDFSQLTDKDEHSASLFVLSLIYYLVITDGIHAGEVVLENNGKIGFKNSVELFCESIQLCDAESISECKELSSSDIASKISVALSLDLNDCDVEEYFTNKIYVKDLDNVEENTKEELSDEDELALKILNMASTLINNTITGIMRTYTDLFSSAYQVIKPVGILSKDGIVKAEGGKLKVQVGYEATEIYSDLANRLGYIECDGDRFSPEVIVTQMISDSNKVCYFPYTLIKFAFGLVSSGNNDYTVSGITTWEKYSEVTIKPVIVKMVRATVIKMYKFKGFFDEEKYQSREAFQFLKEFMGYLYRCLTACILLCNWKELSVGGAESQILGIKIRITDIDHKIPLDNSVMTGIVNNAFVGFKGDDDAVVEPAVKVGTSDNYTVVDMQHKFAPSIVDGEPLFAYTALRALKSSNKKVDWKHLILGKRDDDSVLVVGEDVKFNNKLCHWVMAGSRSGKGVMTLNILAGAIASSKPIFYLDNKPDMASLFRSEQLSGGKMFCVNGDYDASFDSKFKSCDPSTFHWDKRIPAYIKEKYGDSYGSYSAIFYLRAVMFLTSMIYVRGNVRTEPSLYNPLGGKDGVVVVIDELTAADVGISTLLSKNGAIGSEFYSASTLSKVRGALAKGKEPAVKLTELGCWNTDLMFSLNETFKEIAASWKHKGLKGGGTEGDVSDIFILGQNFHSVDSSKLEYIPTNENNTNGLCGDAFYNYLFTLGCDGFFGYNVDHEEYMCTGQADAVAGVKAATRLSASARNFAFVKNLEVADLDKIIDTKDGSSRGISDSAVYFKPFLIFNDADENSSYVAEDFKKACDGACLDFEKMKDMHRNEQGVLEPAIGFIPYVQEQSSGSIDVKAVLRQSYDIGNRLVKAMIPNYDGDCIDFIYDLRPEAMFTCKTMLEAYKSGKRSKVCKLYNEFFADDTGEGSNATTEVPDGISDLDLDSFGNVEVESNLRDVGNMGDIDTSEGVSETQSNMGQSDDFDAEQHERRQRHRIEIDEEFAEGIAEQLSAEAINDLIADCTEGLYRMMLTIAANKPMIRARFTDEMLHVKAEKVAKVYVPYAIENGKITFD